MHRCHRNGLFPSVIYMERETDCESTIQYWIQNSNANILCVFRKQVMHINEKKKKTFYHDFCIYII